MFVRAEGRGTRSELPDLMAQLTSLDQFFDRNLTTSRVENGPNELRKYAILFQAEVLAHTLLRILKALCFEARLGIPKNDLDILTLFQARDHWGLGEGRRLKQFVELRNLSSRNTDQIDHAEIEALLLGRSEWVELVRRLQRELSAGE